MTADLPLAEAHRTLKVGAPFVAVYYALIAFAHTAMLPPEHVVVMAVVAGLSCVYAVVVTVLAHRAPEPTPLEGPALELLMVVIMGNAVLHVVRMPDPMQSTNVLIALMGVGMISRSRSSYLGILVFGAVGLVVAASRNPQPEWAHFGFAYFAASIVASILFFGRRAAHAARCAAEDDARKAREALEQSIRASRQSEQRYRSVFAACPYAIFGVADGRILYANPAAEVLLDIRSGSLVGVPVGAFRPGGRGPVLGDDVPTLTLLDSQSREIEVVVNTVDAVVDDLPITVVFASDRTAEARSQALQNAFITTVNHELRTPLTTLSGAVRMLRTRDLDPQSATLLDVAERGAKRLGALVESLLDLRALQHERLTVDQVVPLSELVDAAVARTDSPRVRVQIDSDGSVRVAQDTLHHALHHLIDNAVKFDPSDAPVDVRIEAHAGGARIFIADRGPGIPRRYRERIFEEFSQEHGGLARPHGGFGVGLSIARAVIQQHNGELLLLDRDGGGSIAVVVLPVYDASRAAG